MQIGTSFSFGTPVFERRASKWSTWVQPPSPHQRVPGVTLYFRVFPRAAREMQTGAVSGTRRPSLAKACWRSESGPGSATTQPRWCSGSLRIQRLSRWPWTRCSLPGAGGSLAFSPGLGSAGNELSGTTTHAPVPTVKAWPRERSMSTKLRSLAQPSGSWQSWAKASAASSLSCSRPAGMLRSGRPEALQPRPGGSRSSMRSGGATGLLETRTHISLKRRGRGTGSSGAGQLSAQAWDCSGGPASCTWRLESPSPRQRLEFAFMALRRLHIGASFGARCRGVWSPSCRQVKRPQPSCGRTTMGTVGLFGWLHQVWQPPFSSWFCFSRR
mmetsp:Transcript_36647/g.116642  ORF Transcript_36647/g.116642 Transcript_36647/m.116642 type:complete len:328 (+) Transcript_36647:862-1845(+)